MVLFIVINLHPTSAMAIRQIHREVNISVGLSVVDALSMACMVCTTDNQSSHPQNAYFKASETFLNVDFPRELDFDDIHLDFNENLAATNIVSTSFNTRGMHCSMFFI